MGVFQTKEGVVQIHLLIIGSLYRLMDVAREVCGWGDKMNHGQNQADRTNPGPSFQL
jgi:hypothetical protein